MMLSKKQVMILTTDIQHNLTFVDTPPVYVESTFHLDRSIHNSIHKDLILCKPPLWPAGVHKRGLHVTVFLPMIFDLQVFDVTSLPMAGSKLKADRPHPRDYPHTPTDYRYTDKHFGLVIALRFSLVHSAKPSP